MKKPCKYKSYMKIKSSFRRKLFMGWVFSLFIPFFVLFIIAFVQYGDSFLKVLSGNIDFWHNRGYSAIEQISRDVNVWSNDSPEFQNHSELNSQLIEYFGESYSERGFILERKEKDIKPFIPFEAELTKEIQLKFKNIDNDMLPEFGSRSITSNDNILEETGYILYRQYDFYYSDNTEGSIFLFIKYTNVPATMLKFIGENMIILIGGLLLVHGLISFRFIKKMTKPFNELLFAMKSYQNHDFTIRLNESIKEPMLKTINTAVNEMASELKQSQEKALRIENQRMEFIAKISHDTKTPLASIRAHAEAFRDGLINNDEKRLKYTNNILKKVQTIDNMINELSLYSDLETGLNQYVFSQLDLNYYLTDIFEELNYDYVSNGLTINYHGPEEKHLFVNLDVERFNRVLMNIIKNSVWYSYRENIIVDVKTSYDEDTERARISIKDNGKGVDSKNLEHLFDSFTRGDAFRDPNKGGSGLGLAIAKTIVEKHNGTIEAKSCLNEYFEIIIELPVEKRV